MRTRLLVRGLKLQERWAGKFASAVLTVEDRLKDILASRGIPREKIHVLMNLPDDRIFRQRVARPPKPADAPFVIVYHGTLARRLGLDIAIEAVARARGDSPPHRVAHHRRRGGTKRADRSYATASGCNRS